MNHTLKDWHLAVTLRESCKSAQPEMACHTSTSFLLPQKDVNTAHHWMGRYPLQQAVKVQAPQPLGLCKACPGAKGSAKPQQSKAVHRAAQAGAHGPIELHILCPDDEYGTAAALVGSRMLADHICSAVPLVPGHPPAVATAPELTIARHHIMIILRTADMF